MDREQQPSGQHEEILEQVILRYLKAVDADEEPNLAALVAGHPELEAELRAFVADQDHFGPWLAPLSLRLPEGADTLANTPLPEPEDASGDTEATSTENCALRSPVSWGIDLDNLPQANPGENCALGSTPLPAVSGYEVLGELGRGGMGVVYKARDLVLKRLVALKMLRSDRHINAEALTRLRAEAEALARLQHHHIVQVFTAGEVEGRPYFVQEFIEGGSLDRVIRGRPQPPREAARLVLLLARAVHAAHGCGIIHRDLKPSNVLLAPPTDEPALNTAYGCPKVADFGLAKYLDSAHLQSSPGVIVGTPAYMAPEQIGGSASIIGPGTDVWALGVILYELLTGRIPFTGPGPLETAVQIHGATPPLPQALQAAVPAQLEAICLRCLQKAPGDRYHSAAALAEDLRRFLEGAVEPEATNAGKRSARRVWALGYAAVTLVLALVAVWWRGQGTEEGQPAIQSSPVPTTSKVLWLSNRGYVELANTQGLVDLNGSFTAEMWVRLDPEMMLAGTLPRLPQQLRPMCCLVGDESWPGVGAGLVPGIRCAGWIFWIEPNRSFTLNIAAATMDWWKVTGQLPCITKKWHHLAIVKTMHEVRVFWDGKLCASKACVGTQFVPCPGNLFLGLRKRGRYADRCANADFRSVRITQGAIYQGEFIPTLSLKKSPETLLLLDCSTGQGNHLTDLSGNNHHGAITGGYWVDLDQTGWEHLNLFCTRRIGDFLRLGPESDICSKKKYSGPIEVTVLARTQGVNVRLHAFNGACVIFNWERGLDQLRVTRPDGITGKRESGSVASIKTQILVPNTWYKLQWLISSGGMDVKVDGRTVFRERRSYDLSAATPIFVSSEESIVDVKSVQVKPLDPKFLVDLPTKPDRVNGIHMQHELDCRHTVHRFDMGPTFDISKSWVLSLDVIIPDLINNQGSLILYGDERIGKDPLVVRQLGNQLEFAVTNAFSNTCQSTIVPLPSSLVRKWTRVHYCYDAPSKTLEAYLNGTMIAKVQCEITPRIDRPMPVWIGGADRHWQRFLGKVRASGWRTRIDLFFKTAALESKEKLLSSTDRFLRRYVYSPSARCAEAGRRLSYHLHLRRPAAGPYGASWRGSEQLPDVRRGSGELSRPRKEKPMQAIKRLRTRMKTALRLRRQQRFSLLVVSDQPNLVSEVAATAGQEFDVQTAHGSGAAMLALADRDFDLLLVEENMRPKSGLQLLAWARQHKPRTARLLLVGPEQVDAVGEAIGRGEVHACVLYPLRADALLRHLHGAAQQSLRERHQAPLLKNLWQMCLELQYTLLEQGRQMEQTAAALIRSAGELEEDNRRLRRDVLEMTSQALIDPLTGLLNRRAIVGIAEHELSRRTRYPAPLAVGLIDVDEFKAINTRHDLPGGDQALLGISRALSGSLRAADRVGRSGGDEFMVVLPQTDTTGAEMIADRLRAAVAQKTIHQKGEAIVVTVSIGFAVVEAAAAANFTALSDLAAAALTEAKTTGRNRAVVRVLGGHVRS